MPPEDKRDDALERPLWDLLGKMPPPTLPSSFPDQVLRRIRLENDSDHAGLRFWWAQSWKMISGLTVAVALLVSSIPYQEGGSAVRREIGYEVPDVSTLMASMPVNDFSDVGNWEASLNDNDIWLGTAGY
ncbi:MAG TPA: hypothetical protein VF585_03580 [Chthoniobacterales bacterium]|jgi:hypothetical protein